MPPKSEPKKRGRKPKEGGYARAVFTRTTEETAIKLEALARRYRITPAELLRWMCEDAVSGAWRPAHLRDAA